MRRLAAILLCAIGIFSQTAQAQVPPSVHSTLLNHFLGHWVLRYTMKGVPNVHEVSGEWVLQHHYLELRETSKSGAPKYEADIFITLDAQPKEYVVFWLDVFGGAVPPSLGRAAVASSRMRFLFSDSTGLNFINDMTYDASSDSWHWAMDNVDRGRRTPFAQMTLTRT